MRKKGFTLIELLAVIAILIILVIMVVPRIINIFRNAKKEAFKTSTRGIVLSADYLYMNNPKEYTFTYADGVESNNEGKKLDYTGSKPKTGIVYIDEEGNVAVALHDGTYCATKSSENKEITVEETEVENCSTYKIITSSNNWSDIATENGIELSELLELNQKEESSPTEGIDIKIPLLATATIKEDIIKQVTDSTPGTMTGVGSSAEPFLIESVEDLVALSNSVNSGINYSGKYITLTINLDFKNPKSYINSNVTTYGDINGNGTEEGLLTELTTGSGFLPIGKDATRFSGYFNGNLNSINNLYINRSSLDYVGLFGYNTGTITALKLNNINITGKDQTGGIAGCTFANKISDITVKGNVKGNNRVGLAIGYVYNDNTQPNVTSIIAEGNVTGGNAVGGLIGEAYTWFGGVGYISGIYKGGSITATGAVGRIAGASGNTYGQRFVLSGLALSSSTINGSTVTSTDSTGLNGADVIDVADINNINLAETALDTYIGGDNDSNGFYWDYDTLGNLVIKSVTKNPLAFSLSGLGTDLDPYIINTYDDLKMATLKLDKVYKLNSNIDLLNKNFYMLGGMLTKFTGKFDGNGKTISNLSLNIPSLSYMGFSGYNQGTIKNLKVSNLTLNGGNYVGFIGYNTGFVTGLTLNNIDITGKDQTGGIAGCTFANKISDITVKGNAKGNNRVGLAIGYVYNDNTQPNVTSIIAEGNVTGGNAVGGLIGEAYTWFGGVGYISGIYKGGSITATGAVGRIAGASGNTYGQRFALSGLALSSSTINGSTVTSADSTGLNGADATLSSLLLEATYTNIGFNFSDETLDYIWYFDTDGIARFREGNS